MRNIGPRCISDISEQQCFKNSNEESLAPDDDE